MDTPRRGRQHLDTGSPKGHIYLINHERHHMHDRRDFLTRLSQAGALSVYAPAIGASLSPIIAAVAAAPADAAAVPNDRLELVDFSKVALSDRFWRPRLETQRQTLVPFALDKTKPAAENLERVARFQKGEKVELLDLPHYVSSDLYKVMEGAAYLLALKRDAALEARMDAIIDTIAAAQDDDGYLYERHIAPVNKDSAYLKAGFAGERRYGFLAHSHELYCMGHMYEAAIAYYQVTGKDKWLKVAEKNAEHINRVFFVGDPAYNGGKPVNQADGHEEIELALAKLYRVTGKPLYLAMAQRFLDIRGVTYIPKVSDAPANWPDKFRHDAMAPSYAQQHAPVAEQREAVGHAVRAAYLYTGMADVGALQHSKRYDTALDAVWHDIVDRKMHITGGLGAVRDVEGFGPPFELPNRETYNETCAAVANVFFNTRLFQLTRDARYMDVAEIALFNNVLAGTNLAGNAFFYVNPLESDGVETFNHGAAGRSPWFDTACCPSNLARLMPQVPGLLYGHADHDLYVNLYASSATSVPIAGGVAVRQEADYPFDGRIELTLTPRGKQRFRLMLRIPHWSLQDHFVPGALYHYDDGLAAPEWAVSVNGRRVRAPMQNGYACLDRVWAPGDKIALNLPMPVRVTAARAEVKADRGRVAITRGPLVYCAEGIDNGGDAAEIEIDPGKVTDARIMQIADGALAGMPRIELPMARSASAAPVRLIPYFAWNNRGEGKMAVWLRTQAQNS